MVKKQVPVKASKDGKAAHIRTIEVQVPSNVDPKAVGKVIQAMSDAATLTGREEVVKDRLQSLEWTELPSLVQDAYIERYSPDFDTYVDNAYDAIRFAGLESATDYSEFDGERRTIKVKAPIVDITEVEEDYLPQELIDTITVIKSNPYFQPSDNNYFPTNGRDSEGTYTIGGSPLFDENNEAARESYRLFCLGELNRHPAGSMAGEQKWLEDPDSFTIEDAQDWFGQDWFGQDALMYDLSEGEMERFAEFDAKHGGYAKEMIEMRNGIQTALEEAFRTNIDYIESSDYAKDRWNDFGGEEIEGFSFSESEIEELENHLG